jgi:putative oxidoreductase
MIPKKVLIELKNLAPMPLRLTLGVGLTIHGGIKLFTVGGHQNIVHLLTRLGVPFADLMGWVVGTLEFFGGLGIGFGVLLVLCAGLNALNVTGLLFLAALAGGIPEPLPGGDPLPTYPEAFLIFAGTLALTLGGGGKYMVDAYFRRSCKRTSYVTSSDRIICDKLELGSSNDD